MLVKIFKGTRRSNWCCVFFVFVERRQNVLIGIDAGRLLWLHHQERDRTFPRDNPTGVTKCSELLVILSSSLWVNELTSHSTWTQKSGSSVWTDWNPRDSRQRARVPTRGAVYMCISSPVLATIVGDTCRCLWRKRLALHLTHNLYIAGNRCPQIVFVPYCGRLQIKRSLICYQC